jgi:stress response protein SCP2
MNKNEILLRRRNKVLIMKGQDRLPEVYIASMLKNLESLGFTFSSQLIEVLRTLSIKEVTNFYKDTLKIIKEMLGGHVYHKPMYPNFPKQVMNMDQAELYINAIIHYVTYGQLLPKYEKEARKSLIDNHKLKIIGLGSNEELMNIFINLLNSKTSLSETDKKDIAWFFVECPEKIINLLPTEIPLKENATYVSYLLLKHIEGSEEILEKYLKTNLETIEEYICQNIVEICKKVLIEIYSLKKPLGKVFIDNRLKDYLVPFSQRSASKAFKTIVRGSKLPIAKTTNTIRGFVYWKQAKDDIVDIDLSAVMYDEDWNYLEHISYTNLKSSKYNACHSGDIVDAPEGASEFIDLDIESIKTYGGRYIMLCINSFSGQTFDTIPECFVGWMSRECPNSGDIYEEKTVENKADITSNTQICVPMIIDVVEGKVIWTDLSLKRHPNWCNNVEGNAKGIVLMGKAMTNLIKPNLYDLFSLNALARGEITSSKKNADIVFSVEDGITPYDTDEIIGKYL